MLECAVGALNNLCPEMEFLVFPSGTNVSGGAFHENHRLAKHSPTPRKQAYGIHIPGGVFTAPYHESMPLPDSYQTSIIYPALRAMFETASAGRQWSWCDIRPDAVIGFVPNSSSFNLAAHWATYLSLYALIHGKGARVPFPSTQKAYTSLYNEASAATVGRALLRRADENETEEEEEAVLKPSEYIKKHGHLLEAKGARSSGSSAVFQGDFLDGYGYQLDFDRQLSLEKLRRAGFGEEVDPDEGRVRAFETLLAPRA
ncbi:MAG: hypothetical protein Q9173_007136 [Seirophora scorigena]